MGMTQADKELLLKDLCARLPYGVIISCAEGTIMGVHWNKIKLDASLLFELQGNDALSNVKPYLRSMSSMTEEERKEYDHYLEYMLYNTIYNGDFGSDYLNAHHLDYHGLIPKGLAIEVTEENNPYKE